MSTTRRNFLGAAAGIAGLSALDVESASAKVEPTPWGIKLGIATYTYRSFPRDKTIELIKAVQTPWVSIKDVHLKQTISPEEMRAASKEFTDAGLKIMSGGNVDMTKDKTSEDLRKHFEYAKNSGIPMMVCAPTHENVAMLDPLVKEYNIKIAIHNHGPEDKHFPTPQSVLDVVRKMDARCGLCMDVGHSARTGVDVVKTIAEAGPRLLDMHIKDLRNLSDKDSQCVCGEGDMPIPGIFKQLKKMNYQGCVNLEYEIDAKDPQAGVLRSFSYMRGVLAGLASA